MQAQRCDCYGCLNNLTTFDEVMSGICDDHRRLILDDDNYAGVCWNCCRVTIVGPRRSHKGELIIKDKYIFSKGCRHCTGKEESNVDWITIKVDSSPTSLVQVIETDEDGRATKCRILPITQNINIKS